MVEQWYNARANDDKSNYKKEKRNTDRLRVVFANILSRTLHKVLLGC